MWTLKDSIHIIIFTCSSLLTALPNPLSLALWSLLCNAGQSISVKCRSSRHFATSDPPKVSHYSKDEVTEVLHCSQDEVQIPYLGFQTLLDRPGLSLQFSVFPTSHPYYHHTSLLSSCVRNPFIPCPRFQVFSILFPLTPALTLWLV